MLPIRVWQSLALLLVLLGVAAAGDPEQQLVEVGHLAYPSKGGSLRGCDYDNEVCAPLSDVFGYHHEPTGVTYALVGHINGMSVVRVNETGAEPLVDVWFGHGCATEWRDIKVWRSAAYVVNDKTALCSCREQPCEQIAHVEPATAGEFAPFVVAVHEGTFSRPLADGGVTAAVRDSNSTACSVDEIAVDLRTQLAGFAVLVDRGGGCPFETKVLVAQDLGAVAVVVVNERPDVVPPSMWGEPTDKVHVPSVMIRRDDGIRIRDLLVRNLTVTIALGTNMTNNTIYRPPDGLWVVRLADPEHPVLVKSSIADFDFAHNAFVEEDRPYLYVCGMNCLPGRNCSEASTVGGILVYSLHDPYAPVLIGSWADAYVHDVSVLPVPGGRYMLYAAAIYDGRVYFIDVTDPARIGTQAAVYIKSPVMAHNAWPTPDARYMYLTHEDNAMPITVWNITDVTHAEMVGNFSFNGANQTIPHNVMMRGPYLWASYYSEGGLLYSTLNPRMPELIGHIDTSPKYTDGFHGVWGVYPYPLSSRFAGMALLSDIEEGLFLVQYRGPDLTATNDGPSTRQGTDRGFMGKYGAYMVGAATVLVLVVFAARMLQKRRAEREWSRRALAEGAGDAPPEDSRIELRQLMDQDGVHSTL